MFLFLVIIASQLDPELFQPFDMFLFFTLEIVIAVFLDEDIISCLFIAIAVKSLWINEFPNLSYEASLVLDFIDTFILGPIRKGILIFVRIFKYTDKLSILIEA